jgi:outer membrane receptor protein involved in Fe transport
MRILLLVFTFFCFSTYAYSTTLKGIIKEDFSDEPLVGATIHLKGTDYGATSGLDGSYHLKNIPAGNYIIVVSFISFETIEKPITISNQKEVVMNFSLKESVSELNAIVIMGVGDRESELSAMMSERQADNVMNIISAKSIELLPDITVGNILQRVSGVSVVRNGSGDGQYAIIRGMDKRYNYTLVNGIKIPSPDNKNRYIPMDIFPSNLLERLEVTKALTPNMEGDAIGGSINMVMKSAPDHLTISATASGGFSDLFASRSFSGYDTKGVNMKSPSEIHGSNYEATPSDFSVKTLQYKNAQLPINNLLNVSIGNRIFQDKLGFFVGGSYQHSYRGSNSFFYRLNGQPSPDPQSNTPIFEFDEKRTYSNEQIRLGGNVKLDYAINSNHKLSLLGVSMQMNDWQHRELLNNQFTTIGDVHISDRSQYRQQTINNITAQGVHQMTYRLKLDWSVATSLAKSITPDWTTQSVTYRITKDSLGNRVESAKYIDPVSHIWTHNQDHDQAEYLNINYQFSETLDVSVGGMVRDKNRSNFYNDYELSTVLPGGDRQIYTTIDQAIFSFRPESYAYADSTNANNYSAKEQVAAYYLQGKTTFNRLNIIGGFRAEYTSQSYISQLPVTAQGKTGSIKYLDILPSIHFKYEFSDKVNFRLSYFKGITRPGFFELVPSSFPGDYFNESGNYNLKHTQADNVDFRYEYFPGGNNRIFIGAFYKRIQDPIEYGFNQINQTVTVYSPINFGTATNYGAEVVFAKYINKWGISGNYTFTQSSITTTKRIYGRDENEEIVNTLGKQKRPLQGQSDHIANLSFIHKNTASGFDAQLSWVYTGKRINIVSPFLGLDYWQRGTSQLDFSSEKKIGDRFSMYLKVTNLLNNPIVVEVLKPNNIRNLPEQNRDDRIMVQKDIFQRTYLLGLRFKL